MEIKKEDIKRFEKIIDELHLLMNKIDEYCPEANIYIADHNIHLMKGHSHDWRKEGCPPLHENSVWDKHMSYIGGGGW